MSDSLIQLIILFFVIFDPLVSLTFFLTATEECDDAQQHQIAIYSVMVASIISLFFLLLGETMLVLFSTELEYFRIAGGIILSILGISMVKGGSIMDEEKIQKSSSTAIASIIGSPVLAGPAAITTIIISRYDSGVIITGTAVGIVLLFTGILLYSASHLRPYISKSLVQVLSSMLGLITISWGVKFIIIGLNYDIS